WTSTSSRIRSTTIPRPPRPTLFPYTTLFRSVVAPQVSQGGDHRVEQVEGFLPARGRLPRADPEVDFPFEVEQLLPVQARPMLKTDRKSTRLNSSHVKISYAVFCLKTNSVVCR